VSQEQKKERKEAINNEFANHKQYTVKMYFQLVRYLWDTLWWYRVSIHAMFNDVLQKKYVLEVRSWFEELIYLVKTQGAIQI